MKHELAPIVLFCYNRINVLKQAVEALVNNILAKDSSFIIFSDGPKTCREEKVQEVRNYIHSIIGFKSIEIIEQKENKGLANSIINGVTQVINKYGKIIVLENDLITSPSFLNYMNDVLNMYENVACITSYTYPIKNNYLLSQSFFIKGTA